MRTLIRMFPKRKSNWGFFRDNNIPVWTNLLMGARNYVNVILIGLGITSWRCRGLPLWKNCLPSEQSPEPSWIIDTRNVYLIPFSAYHHYTTLLSSSAAVGNMDGYWIRAGQCCGHKSFLGLTSAVRSVVVLLIQRIIESFCTWIHRHLILINLANWNSKYPFFGCFRH